MLFKNREKDANLSGIYKITQISTGKVYIGQTKMRFIKRYWHHRWKLNDNTHDNKYLQNSWNKYLPVDFKFSALHVLNREDSMNELEIKYIKDLNAFGSGGFNLTKGGEGKSGTSMPEHAKRIVGEKNRVHNTGKKHSEKTKAKMRASSPRRKLTPEQAEALRQSRIGTKHTDASKKQMSDSHLGIGTVLDNDSAAKVKEMLIDGNTMVEISKKMDISYAVVKSIVNQVAWMHVEVDGWSTYIENHLKNKIHRNKTLADNEVRNIRALLQQGRTQAEISRELNVGSSIISNIKTGRTYKDIV